MQASFTVLEGAVVAMWLRLVLWNLILLASNDSVMRNLAQFSKASPIADNETTDTNSRGKHYCQVTYQQSNRSHPPNRGHYQWSSHLLFGIVLIPLFYSYAHIQNPQIQKKKKMKIQESRRGSETINWLRTNPTKNNQIYLLENSRRARKLCPPRTRFLKLYQWSGIAGPIWLLYKPTVDRLTTGLLCKTVEVIVDALYNLPYGRMCVDSEWIPLPPNSRLPWSQSPFCNH